MRITAGVDRRGQRAARRRTDLACGKSGPGAAPRPDPRPPGQMRRLRIAVLHARVGLAGAPPVGLVAALARESERPGGALQPEPEDPQNFHSSRAERLQRWINSSSSNASISPRSSRAKPSRTRSSRPATAPRGRRRSTHEPHGAAPAPRAQLRDPNQHSPPDGRPAARRKTTWSCFDFNDVDGMRPLFAHASL